MDKNNKIKKIIREVIDGLDISNLNEFDFLNKITNKVKGAFSPNEKEDVQDGDGNVVVKQLRSGGWNINGNIVQQLSIVGTDDFYAYFNSNKETLSKFLNSKFYSQYVFIDKNKINTFVGKWISGDFVGDRFIDTKMTGSVDFNNIGFFGGRFLSGILDINYDYWQTSPTNFIDGTIKRKSDGILGLKNSVDGILTEPIHLIQVPVGRNILIKLKGDSKIYGVKVLKRIDEKNSDFEFENINEEKTRGVVKWSSIRDKFNNFYLRKGRKTFFIPGVINLVGEIAAIKISDALPIKKKEIPDNKKNASYILNIKNIPNIFDGLPDSFKTTKFLIDGDFNKVYDDIINDINKDGGKLFLKHLKNIFDEVSLTRHKIDRKELPNIKYINAIMGSILNESLDSDVVESFKYFNSFVSFIKKYLSDGDSDEILNKLEEYISKWSEKIPFVGGLNNTQSGAKSTEKTTGSGFLDPTGKKL